MHCVNLKVGNDFAGFKRAVRGLIASVIPPENVLWNCGESAGLFDEPLNLYAPPLRLSRTIADLARLVACHRDPEKHALLYALIWRVLNGERCLLEVSSDPLVRNLEIKQKEVRRDLHKMHAFLRFRRVADESGTGERFVAWFEPEHYILEESSKFFVDRFRSLNWSILTPIGSVHWDRCHLRFGAAAAERSEAQGDDPYELDWRTYYENTFNPSRTNTSLMRAHMPRKYWRNMPETQAIAGLVRSAPGRVERMIAQEATAPRKRDPERARLALQLRGPQDLGELNALISASEPLVRGSTRAVLGEGSIGAPIAFVGEQPGDIEDQEGRPFVGPAGRLFDDALAKAGVDRSACYVTNAVKHFKFEQRGKRRIHKTPSTSEVKHYRWWLAKELEFVKPRLVIALGASAGLALTGRLISVGRERGPARFGEWPGYITIHPSYLLRLPDTSARDKGFDDFVGDLRSAADLAATP